MVVNIINTVPRHYRRIRRSAPRSYPKTYKKVLNFAPASHGANLKIDFELANAVDSVAIGQTGPTDANVPTGSTIDFITIQFAAINLGAGSLFMHTTIQNLISGQSATVDPILVGGNPQRNQVHHQENRSLGANQNATFTYRFRVPKSLKRMKEGSRWFLTVKGLNAWTDNCQVIYTVKQ